jgi:hypothetical protein
MPGNVFLPAVSTGLRRDSVANVTAVITLDRAELDEPVGQLPDALMHEQKHRPRHLPQQSCFKRPTTVPDLVGTAAWADLLRRDFTALGPNQWLVADFAYVLIATGHGVAGFTWPVVTAHRLSRRPSCGKHPTSPI